MRCVFLVLVLAMAPHWAAGDSASAEAAAETAHKRADTMKIRLRIKDTTLTATLNESKTARDFVSLLPTTLTMNDLFGREKYGHLPRALSKGAERAYSYEVGEVVY